MDQLLGVLGTFLDWMTYERWLNGMQPCMNQMLKGSANTMMEYLDLGSQQVRGGLMPPGCHISARFPNPPSFDTKNFRESYYYSMSCSSSNEC